MAAIRAVDTTDFTTTDFPKIPHDIMGTVSSRIINEVRGVNRVVYDISSKPPRHNRVGMTGVADF